MLQFCYDLPNINNSQVTSSTKALKVSMLNDCFNLRITSRPSFPNRFDIYPDLDAISYFKFYGSFLYNSLKYERIVQKYIKVFSFDNRHIYTIFDPQYMFIEVGITNTFSKVSVGEPLMIDIVNFFKMEFTNMNFEKVILGCSNRALRHTAYEITNKRIIKGLTHEELSNKFDKLLLDSFFLNLQNP